MHLLTLVELPASSSVRSTPSSGLQILDVGAHEVEVGDERVGHRGRVRRTDELGRQVDDVGVEAHESVDRPVVSRNGVGVGRHRQAVRVPAGSGSILTL